MDRSAMVWILGGYQSDFARNLTKENGDFAALTAEVVDGTLAAAKVDAAGIGVVHVANAFGEMFAGQGHLGAMPATVCDALWDTPASRHEAACASGSVAALSAMADLRSGAYDSALVVGIELEKTVPGDTAAPDEHVDPIFGQCKVCAGRGGRRFFYRGVTARHVCDAPPSFLST